MGQADPRVLYTAHGLGYSLFLTRTGATIVLPNARTARGVVRSPGSKFFTLSFEGANTKAEVEGVEELPGKSNYFSGSDPRLWHTQISQYRKVRYRQLYPGIDVIFYSKNGRMEYDLVAAPGADLSAVHLRASGVKAKLTMEGDVALHFGSSRFELKKPHVYQGETDRRKIPASYSLKGDDLRFSLAKYDHSRSIVIDPALAFSTYLASNCVDATSRDTFRCNDSVTDIAADASGSYITGYTDASSFPATSGAPAPTYNHGAITGFVVKLNPAGTTILYASYIADGYASAMAIDTLGSVFISGVTQAPSQLPLTSGVFSGTMPATPYRFYVPFAAKFSPAGSLLQSTLLQQPTPGATLVPNAQFVSVARIAVDSQGALYAIGATSPGSALPAATSIWMPLPVTQGAYQTTPGSLFALKLTPAFSGLAYGTYIDGNGTQGSGGTGISASGIAVDSNGDAFLSGRALPTFPTTAGSYQPSTPDGSAAFILELNPSGSALVYSTFFPGGSNGIAVDPAGEAVIAGSIVESTSSPLPLLNAFCSVPPPPPAVDPGFVAKLNAAGSALVYSTALCGSFSEGDAVSVDSTGAAYVSGVTYYPATFVLKEPIKTYLTAPSETEEIALKLDTSGNLLWSTFLGTGAPNQSRIAVDPSGSAYVLYMSQFFPTTPGTVGLRDQGTSTNFGANFLVKIAPSLGAPVGLAVPDSVTFPSQNVHTPSTSVDVAVGNFGDAPMSPVVSISGDFSETDTCATAVAPGQKCDVNVTFTPAATGARAGSLILTVGGTVGSETIPLSGTGTAPAVSLSPTSLSFGIEPVGTPSGAQSVTVTNTGTGPLTIGSIQTTSQFNSTNTCGAPVAPQSSCTVQVTFTPTATGSQSGTLTITDDAAGSPQIVSLAGNQPATFSMSAGSGSSLSASVTAGQTANYNLSLAGANGFSGTVSLTCGGAPANSTCAVSPSAPTIGGAAAVPVTVSVSTRAAGIANPVAVDQRRVLPLKVYLPTVTLVIFLLSFGWLARRSPQAWRTIPVLTVLLLAAIGLVACGGGSSSMPPTTPTQPATAPGQYVITVTGNSASVTQSIQLNLTVH